MINIYYLFKKLISLSLFCLFFITIIIQSVESQKYPAEINAYIPKNIPSIKISEWTDINITLNDYAGFNWSQWKDSNQVKYIWPLLFKGLFPFQPDWTPFLGYTSLTINITGVIGNSKGWYFKINPNYISNTTTGKNHFFHLEARIDDSMVDYAIIVVLNITRNNVFGGSMGWSYVYIPLKASNKNLLRMDSMNYKKIASPKSIVKFSPTIINEGYYKDVFQLVAISNNKIIAQFDTQALSLPSGQKETINLTILMPETLFDYGTPYIINITAYSHDTGEMIKIGTFTVINRGIFISPIFIITGLPCTVILLIIIIIFSYYHDKNEKLLFGKPVKPWKLDEEILYLKNIKKVNNDDYEKEMKLMHDEYKSARYWYKFYKKSMDFKEIKDNYRKLGKNIIYISGMKKGLLMKINNFFNNVVDTLKLKKTRLTTDKFIKVNEIRYAASFKSPKVVFREVEDIEPLDFQKTEDKINKELIFLKIKKAQEKQKRKLIK